MRKRSGDRKARVRLPTAATYAALSGLSALFLAPFVWALSASFKTNAEIYEFPPTLLPHPPHPENYVLAATVLPFGQFALNSAVIALTCVAGQLLSGSV